MNGANGTRTCKRGYFSPVYYGDASGLKIVKSYRPVGNGFRIPKPQKKNTHATKTLKKTSSSDETSLTSSEEEITPAPRLPKDNPVIKTGPKLLGATKDTTKACSRENGNTLASEPKASKDKLKDQDSQSIFGDALVDVTFPRLNLGPQGDILALRCDHTCQKRPDSENSPLPGAHLWCRAHQKYHCSSMSSKDCDFVVLCAISVEVYARMRVERHWHWVGRGEEEDQNDGMEISSDEGMEVSSDETMDKAIHNLVATQSSGSPAVGSMTHPKGQTKSTAHDSPMAMDVDYIEKSEDENPRKRVRFSDQDEVFFRGTSNSINPR
ncbi:hypothetical protein DL98DRAFT_523688 [Cadophora sp. DSE1049]|nr:hypothetical protein DL98DRAFT_523688 [Cadophora sp. DSE1049]